MRQVLHQNAWITTSKATSKVGGPGFSPFKLVLVAWSEIENQEFH